MMKDKAVRWARTIWGVAFPTLAVAWTVILFGGFFVWGRYTGDGKPTWWWIVVVALAPLAYVFWRSDDE